MRHHRQGDRLLFLRPVFAIGSSFVKVDLELLGRHFAVTPMAARPGDRLLPLRLLRAARKHELCFVWFADAHAYHAVNVFHLLGKPVVIVPGQYEIAYHPEGDYGLQLEDKRRWRQGMSALRRADAVLAVSEFHRQKLREQKVREARLRLIYHGFVGEQFAAGGEKEPIVVTISHVAQRQRIWIKGLEAFAQAAALLPETRFVLAGECAPEHAEYLQGLADGRLALTGGLSQPQVAELLAKAKVYAQLSATETFGCALAEAMLSECIPVVTNRGSLPEVVGNLGYCVEYGDAEGTAQAIRQALQADHGRQCRQWIMEQFPMEKREAKLLEVIEELLRRK
ncbi:MAG: glycosyltransferase [Armatimonadetes bacterium]|nr:glycosyltransferase [Armatimonadota bacterium]